MGLEETWKDWASKASDTILRVKNEKDPELIEAVFSGGGVTFELGEDSEVGELLEKNEGARARNRQLQSELEDVILNEQGEAFYQAADAAFQAYTTIWQELSGRGIGGWSLSQDLFMKRMDWQMRRDHAKEYQAEARQELERLQRNEDVLIVNQNWLRSLPTASQPP